MTGACAPQSKIMGKTTTQVFQNQPSLYNKNEPTCLMKFIYYNCFHSGVFFFLSRIRFTHTAQSLQSFSGLVCNYKICFCILITLSDTTECDKSYLCVVCEHFIERTESTSSALCEHLRLLVSEKPRNNKKGSLFVQQDAQYLTPLFCGKSHTPPRLPSQCVSPGA